MRWLRVCCCVSLLLAISVGASAPCGAQDYPNKPLRLIVPYAVGGPVDLIGRIVAKRLGEVNNWHIVVDNRPGGSGALGTQTAINSAPDGYTLLAGSTATISVLPAMKTTAIKYNADRDLVLIGLVATGVHVFAVNPRVAVNDIQGLIALAKSQKSPLAAAAGGVVTPDNLVIYLLEREAGIQLSHVIYKGTGPAVLDAVSGHVPIVAADLSALLPFLKNGRLKALGIASLKRNLLAPDIPTMDEQGLRGFESGGWFGIFAPAQTPSAIVTLLSQRLAAALADPATRELLEKMGLTPALSDPTSSGEFVRMENLKWGKLINQINPKHLE